MAKTPEMSDPISPDQIHQRLNSAIQYGSVGFVTELLAISQMLPYKDARFINTVARFVIEQNADLFRIAAEAIISGQDVFRVSHTVIQIFPQLQQIEPASLLDFLKIYDEKTKNDLASGQLFEPVRKRASLNREWAEDLETTILKNEDKRFYSYLLSIYLGLSDSDYEFGYGKIKSICSSDVAELKAIGLRGLGLLNDLPDKLRAETFETLLVNADSPDEAVAANAAFSIARLNDQSSDLRTKRVELSKNSVPAARFEILRQIQFKQGELSADDTEVVKNLCVYDLSLKGFTDSLDSLIYHLVSKDQHEAAKDFLTTWVASHSFEEHQQYNFTELFDSSVFEVLKNRELVQKLITEWLNADDPRYHHVLQEIVSYMGVHGQKNIGLDLPILNTLNDDDVLFVVRKILGFVHDFDISISLILSLLNVDELTEKTAAIVTSVLVEHIGDNYLGKTLDRLNAELPSTPVGTRKLKVLTTAIGKLQKKKDQRSSLSRCDELMPNADHEAELNKAFHKSMQQSMKEARKKSVISNLFAHVGIREGLSTFSFINGEYREPTKMGSFSHGIELPKKDVLDEVGASFERSGFRLAKRGEK